MRCPIHVTDIEAAINHWRAQRPPQAGAALAPELAALAQLYAHLAYARRSQARAADFSAQALAAWLAWYDSQPDTPCIAICSTSQGDAQCKGCGRSFAEVQHWLSLDPSEKRAVWRRITQEGQALRFTRYAERAR